MAAIGLKEGDTIALMLRNEPALMDGAAAHFYEWTP